MLSQWMFKLKMLSRRLSVRAGLFGLLGVISSLAGVYFQWLVPDRFADLVGGEAAELILNMLASSMLIVVTFALSTMVTAYSSANQNATPRATRLIIEDSRSISAISIFLGAFIYSIVSLIALTTDFYGEKGRVILLFTTILVIGAVVWMIIQWVGELKNMGRVQEAIERVREATKNSLKTRSRFPTLGCQMMEEIPQHAVAIQAGDIGYIQNIDLNALSNLAEENKIKIYILHDIGAFIHQKSPLVYVEPDTSIRDELKDEICSLFHLGNNRTFDNDPRYGITVLSGIGVKALSPSLNDPGTAIDVVGNLVQILICWNSDCSEEEEQVKYQRLYFKKLVVRDLFNDAFYNLAKDGIDNVAVVLSLKEAFLALEDTGNSEFIQEAKDHSEMLMERAEKTMTFPRDLHRITKKTDRFSTEYRH